MHALQALCKKKTFLHPCFCHQARTIKITYVVNERYYDLQKGASNFLPTFSNSFFVPALKK
jgi:hypothetical protein